MALIELPPPDIERAAAMRRAAFRPTLFAELYEKYRNDLPSDKNLRHFLITKGFNPKTTDEVIRVYRDTLQFVSAQTADSAEVEDAKQPKVEPPIQPAGEQSTQDVQTPRSDTVNPLTLVGGLTANQHATPTPETVL